MENKGFFKTDENVSADKIVDNILSSEPTLDELEERAPRKVEPEREGYEYDTKPQSYDVSDARGKKSTGALIRKIVLAVSSLVLVASLVVIAVAAFSAEELPDGPYITDDITISLDGVPDPNTKPLFRTEPVWTEHNGYTLARNNHFIGWLKLGDTIVDYPILQYHGGDENQTGYYLHLDFDGNYSRAGSIFGDWHTPLVDERRPNNFILYGHNMGAGTMFARLMQYYVTPSGRDLTFYGENPTINFASIYDEKDCPRNEYKIFAGMFISSSKRHGYLFDYWRRRAFEDKDEFYDFVGQVMDRSVFYTDVDIKYGDEFITMSTCYYPLGNKTDRFVVFARRVRDGEDTKVDTSKAYINESPLFFDYYYRVRGGSWDGRKWDLSKVHGIDEFYERHKSCCKDMPEGLTCKE